MPAKLSATNSSGYAAPAGLAADPVIFTLDKESGALTVLLVAREEAPFKGALQLPGGFVGKTEKPEETAARKLKEKTGVGVAYLEQLRTYADPDRDPRGWVPSIAFLALIPYDRLAGRAADAHEARWVAVEKRHEENLAFDHDLIVQDALERLRGKLWWSNIAMGLLPEEFTTGEAQRVYEAIEGEDLDPGNFARAIKGSGLIVETGNTKKTRTVVGKAYRFRSREPEWSVRRDKGGRAR